MPSDLEQKAKLLYQTLCCSRPQRYATDPASNDTMALQQLGVRSDLSTFV
jgi:hypothetical protein